MKILWWIVGAIIFCWLVVMAQRTEENLCAEKGKRLSAPAVYINGKCMVKGWGKL